MSTRSPQLTRRGDRREPDERRDTGEAEIGGAHLTAVERSADIDTAERCPRREPRLRDREHELDRLRGVALEVA